MSGLAKWYISIVLCSAIAISSYISFCFTQDAQYNFLLLITLIVLAISTQLYEAEHGKKSFYPHLVFFFAGIILLTPLEIILLVTIPHIAESLCNIFYRKRQRRAWYIQPFNIATHIIASISAKIYISFWDISIHEHTSITPILGITVTIIVYVAINHFLIGLALDVARGISFQESGIFTLDSLTPDIVMACLGAIMAILWMNNPWWIILALLPLVLMYQALLVPQLKQQAQTDGKTGLLNARHFTTVFAKEIAQAQQMQRSLVCIMADLDYLRSINNTYGHLAGDEVLIGIGKIIRETIRIGDIAGRFGGEEFSILLPDTDLAGARILAERLRQTIATTPFFVPDHAAPIHVTMSLGIACFPNDAANQTDLLAAADKAVYHAKNSGRNRVVCYKDNLDHGKGQDDHTDPVDFTQIVHIQHS